MVGLLLLITWQQGSAKVSPHKLRYWFEVKLLESSADLSS
jgi:site-specific recombinase XerC